MTTRDLFHGLAPFGFDDGATFSEDRKYRYRLWRSWGNREHRCVFVGLNPSTADERTNDMTITKCIGFAKRWGFGAIDMVNLFALVSTDPKGLIGKEAVGPDNDEHLRDVLCQASRIVWAWGGVESRLADLVRRRSLTVMAKARRVKRSTCEVGTIGVTAQGDPRHPSRLAYAAVWEAES